MAGPDAHPAGSGGEQMTRERARCGTPSGYERHRLDGVKPCDACALAKSEYDRRYRAAPERVRRDRLKARAQSRAYVALRAEHVEEYRKLYRAAWAELLAEAGASA